MTTSKLNTTAINAIILRTKEAPTVKALLKVRTELSLRGGSKLPKEQLRAKLLEALDEMKTASERHERAKSAPVPEPSDVPRRPESEKTPLPTVDDDAAAAFEKSLQNAQKKSEKKKSEKKTQSNGKRVPKSPRIQDIMGACIRRASGATVQQILDAIACVRDGNESTSVTVRSYFVDFRKGYIARRATESEQWTFDVEHFEKSKSDVDTLVRATPPHDRDGVCSVAMMQLVDEKLEASKLYTRFERENARFSK